MEYHLSPFLENFCDIWSNSSPKNGQENKQNFRVFFYKIGLLFQCLDWLLQIILCRSDSLSNKHNVWFIKNLTIVVNSYVLRWSVLFYESDVNVAPITPKKMTDLQNFMYLYMTYTNCSEIQNLQYCKTCVLNFRTIWVNMFKNLIQRLETL